MANETPQKRLSIQQLADLAGTDELPEQYRPRRAKAAEEDFSFPRPPAFVHPPSPPAPPQIYSLRVERIRQMPDDELMRYLTREKMPEDGVLDDGAKMAINAELLRRQAAAFERPAWWKDRNYWVALVAAVGGVIAAVPVVLDWVAK
ncbi:hypothetical protein [Acidovorax sp. Leaf160]|uniref:hypothetical protein n=1 Tax=Acidovorax sp. Leaf160 TaxID=1736280 RepID=UPI0006FCA778|nr:hypothetical protein [Acidovorax sp. Leaf160]KQR62633.1 hypothetical protein ASF94_15550 [Acidovorax sp. Leaf160]